ncbi:MAG: hypothetical protein HUU60_02820 [Armatimonadetes bacterium]|nr:hypothetical protein [Armatimonadota bacterium]
MDDAKIAPHTNRVGVDSLKRIIADAIRKANQKSSREAFNLHEDATPEQVASTYSRAGRELFKYFKKYCGDPASTAYQCLDRHYSEVAEEQFHLRTLQKERMNSGWRYQFIAKDAASHCARFTSVSDLGKQEADFTVTLANLDDPQAAISIYVSVKNRVNTMGGQDWPKAIAALEGVAMKDKNRTGPYLCVFGIAMDRGQRLIKRNQSTDTPHSFNTEIWRSDYFWPFFTALSYEEVVSAVLDVLLTKKAEPARISQVPREVLDSFGDECKKAGLLDSRGRFNNSLKLVKLFCGVRSD